MLHKVCHFSSWYTILKVALGKVLNMNDEKLASFAKQMNHPMVFTISIVGIRKTMVGFVKQAYKAYKKRK